MHLLTLLPHRYVQAHNHGISKMYNGLVSFHYDNHSSPTARGVIIVKGHQTIV